MDKLLNNIHFAYVKFFINLVKYVGNLDEDATVTVSV